MSRWIDADAIKDKAWKAESEACFYALEDVVSVTDIDEAPSIDIVRCSECRLNETDGCPMAYCTPLEDGDFETRWWNRPDDSCSWGEREGE